MRLALLQTLTGKAHPTPTTTQEVDSHCLHFVEAERGQPLKTRWGDSGKVTGSGAKAMLSSSRAGMQPRCCAIRGKAQVTLPGVKP